MLFSRNLGLANANPADSDPYWASVIFLAGFDNNATNESTGTSALTLVGSSTYSSAVVKYGTHSVNLADGANTNYYTLDNDSNFVMGTGDFTIETWVQIPSQFTVSGNISILGFNMNINESTYKPIAFLLSRKSTTTFTTSYYDYNAFNENTASTMTFGSTWYHIAVCRASGVIYLCNNGTVQSKTYSTRSIDSNHATDVRIKDDGYRENRVNLYFDEFRVTKGVARYTGNYTPPAAKFPRG
jgi:hypothetical protein